jgi:hypothetical protein
MRYTVSKKNKGRTRRIGGTADYIVPLGIVGLGAFVVYKLFNGGLLGAPPIDPKVLAQYGTQGSVTAPGLNPTTNMDSLNLEAQMAIQKAVQAANANSDTSPFLSGMYLANPANASIDQTTAQNLYQNLLDNDGGFFQSGNFTGILGEFQAVVGNQTDISFVAYQVEQGKGKNMMDWIMQSSTYGNSAGNGDNQILVWQFVQWVLSLPQN